MHYFAKTNYDGYFLEYDDDRSGGFEPLKYFAQNPHKGRVVLGLVSSKFPDLEDKDVIKITHWPKLQKYVAYRTALFKPSMWFCLYRGRQYYE